MTAAPDAPVLVRVARTAADWQAVRTLCCQTGNGGDPIDPARWPLFGDLWIGPYQRLVPEWTYVAEAEDRIVGYLTGCPDTAALRRARRFRVTLPLLVGIACGRYGWTPTPGGPYAWPCGSAAAWSPTSLPECPGDSGACIRPTCT